MSNNDPQLLQPFADAMKRDWDDRAREDSRWYINTIKRNQNDDEFDATGRPEVENFVLNEPLIVRGRDLKTARLLEIGCGIGRMTRHLAKVFGEVHGTDVSAEMIEQARRRFCDSTNTFFYETNGLDFAVFPDDYFDVIFSVYVFQHVPSPEVVHSNIRDACRVLKPGGVFKFQICGIDHPDYDRMPKDTWTGTPFPEREIRRAALENGMRCRSIHGLRTQYCWAVFQKPEPAIASQTTERLRIEGFGRTDAPEIQSIPTNGEHASLSLFVSGLNQSVEDANSVIIEINGHEFQPHYVGECLEYRLQPAEAGTPNTRVSLCTSAKTPRGLAEVRVKDSRGRVSNAAVIKFLEPETTPPKIHMINNAVDGGVDISASGEKAVFRVFADGMDETAGVENVRMHMNDLSVAPASVTFLPANGFYLTIAEMPAGIAAGEVEVKIQFNDLLSAPAKIRIIG